MAPYLTVESLSVSYGGTRVLHGVSLDVARGELVALLGSSGCGKTTLLRSIAGFVTPDAGAIKVEGRDLLGLPPEKRDTAMMFQSYALWPHMSVADNIAYGLRMRGARRDAIDRRVGEMLTLLKLDGYGPRPPTQLSGGQRQRVALGRALAVDPRLLLLDEPMSNLDYKVRIELRHELRALQQRIGITAVYVTHDREEALTLADRIAVLDAGRIAQYGTPEEIFHQPASAFVAGFMGADNAIEVRRLADGALAAHGGGIPAADAQAEARGARNMGADGAAGTPLTAHFRSDAARVYADAAAPHAHGDELRLPGVVAQTLYVGQGYRYRVRTARAEVWGHASERMSEGAPVTVCIPGDALLLFPRAAASSSTALREDT